MWFRSLALWLLSLPALAGTATLTWEPPTERTDGSPLTNLASYRVYERCGGGSLALRQTVAAPASAYVRAGIPDDGRTCWWRLTAVDATGIESAQTAEVSKSFPATPIPLPGAPGNLQVTWQAAAEPPTGPPKMASVTGSIFVLNNDFASPASGTATVPADAELAILVAAGYVGTANWLTNATLTLGGNAFTDIAGASTDNQTSNEQLYVGYLVSPPTGSQTFSATWTGSPSEGPQFYIIFLTDVDTTNPIKDSDENTSGSASFSITALDAATGDYSLGIYSNYNQYGTLTGGTQLQQTAYRANNLTVNGGDGVTSFSFATGNFATGSAIVVRNAGGGGGGASFNSPLFFMGMGR